ncbi:hypothetical protein HOV35_gp49 [Escherichia phage Sortsne]|uniref:Uncharacterized protein n=1 Tax=Escherichia phage Sortsne TaxID=2562456 RepID=A0A4D6DZ50_9CAUD|nr:hypothetical protein HOV35_gp49 [Escherichia phage Sortsne]QBZ71614.1 hypothetical protein [Escherichia phage Sortsne]
METKERSVARSRAEALLLKRKTYHGGECKEHPGNFTRYTTNGSCVICAAYSSQRGGGKVRGYIAKKADSLAYRHPVSPWPITPENMHLCPDLSPGKGSPWT